MKPFLFAAGSETSFRLQLSFARYCVGRGRAVAFVSDRSPDLLHGQMRDRARAIGAEVYSLDSWVGIGRQSRGRLPANRRLARAAWLRLKLSTIAHVRRYPGRHDLQRRLAAAHALFDVIDPAILIVAEDGVSGPAELQGAAAARGLAVVDIPYAYDPQSAFDRVLERKVLEGMLVMCEGTAGELVRTHAPWWIKQGRFEGALMFPPELVLWREALGMGLRDPWNVHGGFADVLFAESAQMLDLYRAEGVPEQKLVLTGTPYCDDLLEGLDAHPEAARVMRRPARMHSGRTRILVSWPPSLHASRGAHSEFPTYDAMTRAILGWLQQLPACDVTVSLHPAAPEADAAAVRAAGVRVTDDYVLTLIPQHDLFISYYSSTIRWAVVCGKPVVNYDAYGLNAPLFDSAPGVITVSSLRAFQAAVTGLVTSEATYAEASRRQLAAADRWGLLDGRCRERIYDRIETLL